MLKTFKRKEKLGNGRVENSVIAIDLKLVSAVETTDEGIDVSMGTDYYNSIQYSFENFVSQVNEAKQNESPDKVAAAEMFETLTGILKELKESYPFPTGEPHPKEGFGSPHGEA